MSHIQEPQLLLGHLLHQPGNHQKKAVIKRVVLLLQYSFWLDDIDQGDRAAKFLGVMEWILEGIEIVLSL